MVLAGGTTECVWAAAEYVTKPNQIAEMLDRIRRPERQSARLLSSGDQSQIRKGKCRWTSSYVPYYELAIRGTRPNPVSGTSAGKGRAANDRAH